MSSSNTKQRYWFIDRGKGNRIGFVEKVTQAQSKEGVTIDYQPISEAKSIVIYAEASDTDIAQSDSANTTYSNIPDRFIEGLVSKVIADGYKDPRNMNVEGNQLFATEFAAAVKLCKKWLRSNFTRTGAIAPHEF
tara:strand:+ start:1990 stop:2394 length:405 start_codon:yes stop_codon:yes gene_type:complete